MGCENLMLDEWDPSAAWAERWDALVHSYSVSIDKLDKAMQRSIEVWHARKREREACEREETSSLW